MILDGKYTYTSDAFLIKLLRSLAIQIYSAICYILRFP